MEAVAAYCDKIWVRVQNVGSDERHTPWRIIRPEHEPIINAIRTRDPDMDSLEARLQKAEDAGDPEAARAVMPELDRLRERWIAL